MRFTKLSLAFICFLSWHICSLAQSDDIVVIDSTSTGWGDGIGGGGLNPHEPDEPVTSLTLSKSQLTLEGGECVRLVATVNPTAKDKKIIWTSDNSDIASVEADGTVMGLTIGTATVTATAAGNTSLKRTCRVTVISNNVLPNVPFEFLYVAADYDVITHSIPNHKNARLKNTRLQLTENLPTVVEDGMALRISDRCEGFLDKWDKWSNESGAYFYRSGQDCMTIVAKVAPQLNSGRTNDFIANRGYNYNYMWRIGENNKSFLHTGEAYNDNRCLPIGSEQPQVLAVRVDGVGDYILLQNLTTQEQQRVDGVHWGGWDSVFKVFYNDSGEYFSGDFYWVYYSFELLTDDQLALFGRSDFEDGIKSIDNRQWTMDNEASRTIYDLSGRKLSNGKLSRGIYIINNRKVLFR